MRYNIKYLTIVTEKTKAQGPLGDSLLRYQKTFAGLVAGKRGRYHTDQPLYEFGMLKVEDLYRQQLTFGGSGTGGCRRTSGSYLVG